MHLQLLHTPSLHLADGQAQLLPPNDAALLAVLAIDGPTARETMAHLLWPDAAGDGARANLRQRLSRWKKRAGLVLDDGGGHSMALPLARAGTAPGMTAPAAATGTTVSHDLQGLPERLQADPNAAAGQLLGSHAYDDNPRLAQWVQRARTQWRDGLLEALAAIAERLEGEHRIAEALPYAHRIAHEDALAEHAHRRLMRLHYLRGDRSSALAAYDRLRTLLRDELGTVPSKETLDLGRLVESGGGVAGASAPPARPVAVLRPPRLVGREAEARRLQDAWHEAETTTALVSGEAGIGKSRFIQEMADALAIALRVQARQGDAGVPYAVLGRLLRAAMPAGPTSIRPALELPGWAGIELARIVPEWNDHALPQLGPLEPVRLAQAARLVLQGHAALLLDDLQFADAATLDLLSTLVAPPMRSLLAVRNNEMPPAVGGWLQGNTERSVLHIRLGPLAEPGVTELLQSLALPTVDTAQWAGVLMKHTGGHPLFLLETVRELLRDLPPGGDPSLAGTLPMPTEVGRLIERRFDGLSAPALKLLRLAALAGQDCTVELAAAVLRVDALALADPWSELEAASMLCDRGFTHDLIQDAAAQTIPRSIARALHHAIAECLERTGGAAARIAEHWVQAQQWAAAAAQYSAAAALAEGAARFVDAVALHDLAANYHERVGNRRGVFAAKLAAADAAVVASHGVDARADALLALACSDEERLAALLLRATYDLNCCKDELDLASQALLLATQLKRPVEQFRAAGIVATLQVRGGCQERGLHLFKAHLQTAEAALPDKHANEFLGFYALALYYCNRFAEAGAQFAHVGQVSAQSGRLENAMLCEMQEGFCRLAVGDLPGASACGNRALSTWLRMDEPSGLAAAIARMSAGLFFATEGRHASGLLHLTWGLEQFVAGHFHPWVANTQNHLALAYLRLGQRARASQTLPAVFPEHGQPMTQSRWIVTRCLIEQQEGRPLPSALADQLTNFTAPLPDQIRLLMQLQRLVLLPPDDVVDQLRCLHAEASDDQPPIALHARIRESHALSRHGRHAEAVEAARAVQLQVDGCSPKDLEPAEFWWLLFQVFDAADASGEALQALRNGKAAIQHELPHVPDEFRDSFLHRNPHNRNVLAAASRLGLR